jgi:hypothetical protein
MTEASSSGSRTQSWCEQQDREQAVSLQCQTDSIAKRRAGFKWEIEQLRQQSGWKGGRGRMARSSPTSGVT